MIPHHHSLETKQAGNPIRCLVVDDDPIILKLLAAMLSTLGYQVASAQNRSELMRELASGPYAVAILDLVMPDMNGFLLATMMKKEGQASKIIIMTGSHKDDCEEMMATELVDGWIFKPFNYDELLHKLEDN